MSSFPIFSSVWIGESEFEDEAIPQITEMHPYQFTSSFRAQYQGDGSTELKTDLEEDMAELDCIDTCIDTEAGPAEYQQSLTDLVAQRQFIDNNFAASLDTGVLPTAAEERSLSFTGLHLSVVANLPSKDVVGASSPAYQTMFNLEDADTSDFYGLQGFFSGIESELEKQLNDERDRDRNLILAFKQGSSAPKFRFKNCRTPNEGGGWTDAERKYAIQLGLVGKESIVPPAAQFCGGSMNMVASRNSHIAGKTCGEYANMTPFKMDANARKACCTEYDVKEVMCDWELGNLYVEAYEIQESAKPVVEYTVNTLAKSMFRGPSLTSAGITNEDRENNKNSNFFTPLELKFLNFKFTAGAQLSKVSVDLCIADGSYVALSEETAASYGDSYTKQSQKHVAEFFCSRGEMEETLTSAKDLDENFPEQYRKKAGINGIGPFSDSGNGRHRRDMVQVKKDTSDGLAELMPRALVLSNPIEIEDIGLNEASGHIEVSGIELSWIAETLPYEQDAVLLPEATAQVMLANVLLPQAIAYEKARLYQAEFDLLTTSTLTTTSFSTTTSVTTHTETATTTTAVQDLHPFEDVEAAIESGENKLEMRSQRVQESTDAMAHAETRYIPAVERYQAAKNKYGECVVQKNGNE
jgi:hypothetical protein